MSKLASWDKSREHSSREKFTRTTPEVKKQVCCCVSCRNFNQKFVVSLTPASITPTCPPPRGLPVGVTMPLSDNPADWNPTEQEKWLAKQDSWLSDGAEIMERPLLVIWDLDGTLLNSEVRVCVL